jgi:hypothetical protein
MQATRLRKLFIGRLRRQERVPPFVFIEETLGEEIQDFRLLPELLHPLPTPFPTWEEAGRRSNRFIFKRSAFLFMNCIKAAKRNSRSRIMYGSAIGLPFEGGLPG